MLEYMWGKCYPPKCGINFYIAQVKRKCGIIERENYNLVDKNNDKAYIRPNNFERKHRYVFIRN